LATGEQGSATQYQNSTGNLPFGLSRSEHPIVKKNLGGIKFDFANPIDTLKTESRKPFFKERPNTQKNRVHLQKLIWILWPKKQVQITISILETFLLLFY
jgi:hypothetical protein